MLSNEIVLSREGTNLKRSVMGRLLSFSVDGRTRNAVRLNFTNVKPGAIREGVRRLSEVIRAALEASRAG
jgi:DNA-binding transcriptional MocR family regulator